MKVLVTGATGYIGAHVVYALSKLGYEVTAVDNNWGQNDISNYAKRCVNWDIRFKNRLIKDKFSAVIHLAALTSVARSVAEPLLYYRANLLGTHNVIECLSTEHFIYCSTGAAAEPSTSPYALSKRAAEDLVSVLPNYSICRFYNVSGNNGFKKYDDSYSHLIRKAALVANGLSPSLTIFGTDYNTKDGTTIRNYTHISDIVQSIVNIIKNGPTKSVENLGNINGFSVLEVIAEIKKISGVDFPVLLAPRRAGDSATSILGAQSKFFNERHSLLDQCSSALKEENTYKSTQSQNQS